MPSCWRIEQVILELPLVREAVVSGERHAMMGQIVTARVALVSAMDAREAGKAIRAHCRSHLAPYKVPVKIEIVEGGLTSERQKARRSVD